MRSRRALSSAVEQLDLTVLLIGSATLAIGAVDHRAAVARPGAADVRCWPSRRARSCTASRSRWSPAAGASSRNPRKSSTAPSPIWRSFANGWRRPNASRHAANRAPRRARDQKSARADPRRGRDAAPAARARRSGVRRVLRRGDAHGARRGRAHQPHRERVHALRALAAAESGADGPRRGRALGGWPARDRAASRSRSTSDPARASSPIATRWFRS